MTGDAPSTASIRSSTRRFARDAGLPAVTPSIVRTPFSGRPRCAASVGSIGATCTPRRGGDAGAWAVDDDVPIRCSGTFLPATVTTTCVPCTETVIGLPSTSPVNVVLPGSWRGSWRSSCRGSWRARTLRAPGAGAAASARGAATADGATRGAGAEGARRAFCGSCRITRASLCGSCRITRVLLCGSCRITPDCAEATAIRPAQAHRVIAVVRIIVSRSSVVGLSVVSVVDLSCACRRNAGMRARQNSRVGRGRLGVIGTVVGWPPSSNASPYSASTCACSSVRRTHRTS